jgi:hypothetical protein
VTVTAAAFARLCGVSKVAVSKAPPTKIHKEPDGSIELDNPVNAIYLAMHTGAATPAPKVVKVGKVRPAAKPDAEDAEFQKSVLVRQVKKAARDQIKATDAGADDLSPQEKREQAKLKKTLDNLMGETIDLDKKKKLVDIALKTILEKNHAFKLAKAKGEVIDRAEFRRVAEIWNASLGQNVMRVPRRVMSRLWAMAKAGDDARDGELMLERELSKAVGRALEGVAKGHV